MPSQSNFQDPQEPPEPRPTPAQAERRLAVGSEETSETEYIDDSFLNFEPDPNNPDYNPLTNESIADSSVFPSDVVNLQEGIVGVGITGKAVVFSQGTVVDLEQLEGNNLKEGNYDALLRSRIKREEQESIEGEFFDTDDTLQYALEQQRNAEKLNKDNYNKDEQKRNNNKLLKRLFGARSFLYRTGDNPFVIPFHENPTIEEKRGIVYSEIVVLGGPPLVSVKNLNLKNIRLTFKLTIPHIAEMLRTEGENELETFLMSRLTAANLDQKKKDDFFKNTNTLGDNNLLTSRTTLFNLRKDFIVKTTTRPPSLISRSQYISFNSKDDKGDSVIVDYRKNYVVYNDKSDYYLKAQSKVYDYLNHIRSLVGDVDSSTVYLNYTPIFNNNRYAVDGYEIREATNKTYDITTLMCNNYEIVLNLRQLNSRELKKQDNLSSKETEELKQLESRRGNL